jgi:FkbM family methyltransferase
MRKIAFRELVPPLFFRILGYLERKTIGYGKGLIRIHPFEVIPNDITVKWVLDVGANVGDVAVAALKSFPDAQVICFEPVSSTYKILTKRMESYSKRSYLYNVALSDVKDTGVIHITNYHGANSISPQAQFHQDFNPHIREVTTEKISLVCLDDFASKFPTQKIDIMKIDVEGHELNVLKGGARFISKNVDIIIIEISLMRDQSLRNQAVFEIFSFFNEIGFCLLNVMDLHPIENQEMQLVQMDCVFRNIKNISES